MAIADVDNTSQIAQKNGKRLAMVTVAVAVAAVLLYVVDPNSSKVFPPCPFHTFTGLYCPGCGTTRGLHLLLHGHLLTALRFNVLMVVTLPFLAYTFLSDAVFLIRGKRLPSIHLSGFWVRALFIVMMVYWVARNIPGYPFSLLRP